jgi:hypothetical protein
MVKNVYAFFVCFLTLFVPTGRILHSQESIDSLVAQFRTIRLVTNGQVKDERFITDTSDDLSNPSKSVVLEIEKITMNNVPIRWKSFFENPGQDSVTRLPFSAERPLRVILKDKRILTQFDTKWIDLGIEAELTAFSKKEYFAASTGSKHCLVVELDHSISRMVLRAFRTDGKKDWEQKIPFESSAANGTGVSDECEISILSSSDAINLFGVRGDELIFCQISAQDGSLLKFWSNRIRSQNKR